MHRSLLATLVLCLFMPTIRAQFEIPGNPAAATTTTASLVADSKTIAPNSTFTVALTLAHPEGWHSYYQNSGGVEQAPSIQWSLPAGFSAAPIQWPTPDVKDGLFGKSFVYPGSPVFLVSIKTPATLEIGKTITLTANASWQICSESCLNEEKSFTLTLATAAQAEKDSNHSAIFEKALTHIPEQPTTWTFSANSAGDDITLRVTPNSADAPPPVDFVPDQPFMLAASAGGSIKQDGHDWLITLKRATKDALANEIPQGKELSGILTGKHPVRVPTTTINHPSTSASETKTSANLSLSDFLRVLGGMLIGGLILNLMPCVFPVIGLKIMGFVQQAGANRKKVVLHGITFATGVFASFGVLSGILFILRSASGSKPVGWGYQLQEPWVVLALMMLLFVMALNMFGVFEIGTSATSVGGSLQSKHGLGGSFFSGVLATVVATPCSAPFLGTAIGVAITLPAGQFFAAFAAMAAGLALPYLILSIFPALIDYLPRPGPWMESFKQAMSFLLFATTGYLLWVYSGLIDVENLLGPIFGLTAVAVAAWIHGRWNLPHRNQSTRTTALVLTLAFAAIGIFLSKPPQPSTLTWEPWTEAKVESLLKQNKPVYIDFTAKWCATCQMNKKRAYTKEVVDLMLKKGVTTLRADKTKAHPEIEAALDQLGRTAIPVNVLLVPGKPPIIFPEILTPDALTEALKNL